MCTADAGDCMESHRLCSRAWHEESALRALGDKLAIAEDLDNRTLRSRDDHAELLAYLRH